MKKNKKGFTLVELIVVMALMGIVMTAVMMIIKPTNDIYRKVNVTENQEAVCILAGNDISGELKYAKDVAIIKCSSGTAFPTGFSASQYPNVIKIDNTAVRSDSKKGAVGVFQKGTNTGSGIGNMSYIVNQDIYDEDSYRITIAQYGKDTTTNYLTLNFAANSLDYDGHNYVENTDSTYNYSKTIEFTNITNRGMIGSTGTLDVTPATGGSNEVIYIFYSDPDTP